MKFIPANQIIIGKGAQVAWASDGVDISQFGKITDTAPVDPDGYTFDGMVEVTWEDGETEILDRSDLVLVVRN
jgi:hypothetical protein